MPTHIMFWGFRREMRAALRTSYLPALEQGARHQESEGVQALVEWYKIMFPLPSNIAQPSRNPKS